MCVNTFTASSRVIQLASSFLAAITTRSFNLLSPVVVRKYVFTRLRDEKNFSLEAVDIGNVNNIELFLIFRQKLEYNLSDMMQ